MLNYIKETLNIKCSQINLPLEETVLPIYMDLYEMLPFRIGDIQVLFITPIKSQRACRLNIHF